MYRMAGVAGVALAMIVAAATPAAAQADAQVDYKAAADAYLATAYPADGPGAAVVIAQDGRVVYTGASGMADVAGKQAITPDTVFRLGSITKQFAAAVVLQLAAEGKLSLNDPLSKFFPDYPKPGADATVAQLLNHTVGIQSYTGIPGWMIEANTNRAYTTDELIAVFRDLPAPFKPGERFQYNNSGYVLVGAVIEKVAGKPWHVAIEERITRPLGLTSIRYGVGEDRVAGMATGYTDGAAPAMKIHMSVPHAAGALIGNVRDLAKWNQALHSGKVVPAPYYQQMIAPTKLLDGSTVPYGFGVQGDKVRGVDAIQHGGGIFGFSTDGVYLPSKRMFVAVFANSDSPDTSPSSATRRLAAIALGNPYPAFTARPVDMAATEPLLGVYRGKDVERRFFARGGKLYTQRSGGGELEVFAAGDDRFFYGPNSLTWFTVKREVAGGHVMTMYQDGGDEGRETTRSGPIPPEAKAVEVPRATMESYAGNYRTAMGVAKIVLGADGALTVQLGGQPVLPLRAVAPGEFEVQGVGAKVVFKLEGTTVKGLVIQQGGGELPGERIP